MELSPETIKDIKAELQRAWEKALSPALKPISAIWLLEEEKYTTYQVTTA